MAMNLSITSTMTSTLSNGTDDGSDDYNYKLFRWHGAEIVFLIVIFIVGVIGNVLVLYIYHFRWRKSTFTFFIKLIASLDLFNCVVSLPLFLVMTVISRNDAFVPLCKTTSYIAMSNSVASAVVLAIVAFDRNRKIHRPLQHDIKESTTRKLGVFAVFTGLALAVPGVLLFGTKKTQYTEDGTDFNITWCFFSDGNLGSTFMYVYVAVLSVVFLVIMVAMVALYFSIWRALRSHLRRRESLGCQRSSSMAMTKNGNYYRSQKTTAKLFFIITVAFFISYFPYYISVAVFLLDDYEHNLDVVKKSFADLAKLTPMASCAINPLIYSISSARFRREITRLFQRVRKSPECKKKALLNSLNSQELAGQLNMKHSRSHSGSSFGLKSVSNDQIVFGKITGNGLAVTEKRLYA